MPMSVRVPLLFLILFSAQIWADPFALPDFGSTADTLLSAREERALGRAFMQKVRKSLPVLEDPLLNDYLQDLGKRLVQAADASNRAFHFFFIDRPWVNAFAGPDGYIGVYAGLLLTSQSESELAAVLAHEIAHVTQRHLLRALEDQQRFSGPTLALMIAAAILGAQVDSNVGAAALAGIQAASLQHQINFTRHNEEEADRLGIQALAKAGFDPYAMAGFFQRLARHSRTYGNDAPEFLRTHPVTANRIADALARADRYGHKQRPDDLRYHLARARLRVLGYQDPQKALAYFKTNLQAGRYRNRTAEIYGYALSLVRAHRKAEAKPWVKTLREQYPNQAAFLILDAKLSPPEAGIRMLRTAVGLRPDHLPLRVAYAELLTRAGKAEEALATLKGLLRFHRGNAYLYGLMEDAALKAGKKAATHRYRGEKLYHQGDLKAAIQQLELALRTPGIGFHEAAEIQARLLKMRAEQKAQKKEHKKKGNA